MIENRRQLAFTGSHTHKSYDGLAGNSPNSDPAVSTGYNLISTDRFRRLSLINDSDNTLYVVLNVTVPSAPIAYLTILTGETLAIDMDGTAVWLKSNNTGGTSAYRLTLYGVVIPEVSYVPFHSIEIQFDGKIDDGTDILYDIANATGDLMKGMIISTMGIDPGTYLQQLNSNGTWTISHIQTGNIDTTITGIYY
jgi:hypothetical protein